MGMPGIPGIPNAVASSARAPQSAKDDPCPHGTCGTRLVRRQAARMVLPSPATRRRRISVSDYLLMRAARVINRSIPTADVLRADLAQALDDLEPNYPDGAPPKGGGLTEAVARLEHTNLLTRVQRCRRLLEDGDYAASPLRRILPGERSSTSPRALRYIAYVDRRCA